MTPGLLWLLIVWGALTVVLVILLIYRSTLTMQEDDQLFLDDSASAMAKDQMELMAKVNKITPVVKYLGADSGSHDPGDRRLGRLSGIERRPALSASLRLDARGTNLDAPGFRGRARLQSCHHPLREVRL